MPRDVSKYVVGVVAPASSAIAMTIALNVDPGVKTWSSGARPE